VGVAGCSGAVCKNIMQHLVRDADGLLRPVPTAEVNGWLTKISSQSPGS
jgi:hypothetical protein